MTKVIPVILMFASILCADLVNLNPDPDGEPWWAGGWKMPDEKETEKINSYPELILPERYKKSVKELPYAVNNADQKYFRPVFNQQGGSCAQASGVGYVFTYEMNFTNDTDASLENNQFPTHYTYNFLNEGSGGIGSHYFGGWDIIRSCGVPNVTTYGGMWPSDDPDTMHRLWMDGFDKYQSGMNRKVTEVITIPVGTPEGLETLKQFFNDHCDGSPGGGIVSFSAGVSYTFSQGVLPSGTENAGQRIVLNWDENVNHAMTFVGYNDSIRWDYNTDGRYSNYDIDGNLLPMTEWEVGGLLMANSWGEGWSNGGFSWVAYRTLAQSLEDGGIWNNAVYGVQVRDDFSPTLYLNSVIDYSERNELKIFAGVSADTTAAVPEHTIQFPHFNYQGGTYGMQGESRDLELGLDISPLLSYIGSGETAKFFLGVEHKQYGDTPGRGSIDSLSVTDEWGNEYISTEPGVNIATNDIVYAAINADFSFDAPQITDDVLPDAQPGEFYNYTLTAQNGSEPYTWDIIFEYNEDENPEEYPSIGDNILQMTDNDDGYAVIDLDFDFPFYGELYNNVTVLTDGSIIFEPKFEYVRSESDIISFKTISPYSADLMGYPAEGDAVYYSKDENSLTVRWVTSMWEQSDVNLDFACRIHSDSRIEFFYGADMTTAITWASGISNGKAADAVISSLSNLNDPSGMKNGFSTEDYPYGLELSTEGVFSGTTYEAGKTWMVKTRVTDDRNISSFKDLAFSTLTSVDETGQNLVSDFVLLNNYPNPFNPSTTINFNIGTGSRFTLKLYNTSGAVVDEIFENKFFEPGNYSYNWNKGKKLSSGIYFFGLETARGVRKMNKITILK